MENAGWIAIIIVEIILAAVMCVEKFSKDRENNTNKKDINDTSKKDINEIRLCYEDYTQAEARYVQIALQNGCKFNRLYSLQQAGYGPKHIVMYVRLRELYGYIATEERYRAKMNFSSDRDQRCAEEQVFKDVWNWCISRGYLVAEYCVPSNGGVSRLMYENKL